MKVRILLLTLICFSSGCVDVIPIPKDEGGSKLFVLCELKAGERITANVSISGDANGTLPKFLNNMDSLRFSLSEGESDENFSFTPDNEEKNYFIDPSQLRIKIAQKYKFKGVNEFSSGELEPQIIVPQTIVIDSFIINKKMTENEAGKVKTFLDCTIKIKSPESLPAYFYIIPTTENGTIWKVEEFRINQGAYKRMEHRDGFLVDYSRISNDQINLVLSVTETTPTKGGHIEFNNVTESFYRFNAYKTNVLISEGVNPPIASFNIMTSRAYGTFSALAGTSMSFEVK
ncbi:MAG: DUF4249 family protein [Saprospiraceae bacterium]|nr:DUF4249 family protein [Saprospiraceae bacterium]